MSAPTNTGRSDALKWLDLTGSYRPRADRSYWISFLKEAPVAAPPIADSRFEA